MNTYQTGARAINAHAADIADAAHVLYRELPDGPLAEAARKILGHAAAIARLSSFEVR